MRDLWVFLLGWFSCAIGMLLRGRKVAAFPALPIELQVNVARLEERLQRPGTLTGITGPLAESQARPFDGDVNVVEVDGQLEYHGPDKAHANRVAEQFRQREGVKEVKHLINGVLFP